MEKIPEARYRKRIPGILLGVATGLLVLSILLLARQYREMSLADPLRDTGLSFGLVFLNYACAAAASLWGLSVIWFLARKGRKAKRTVRDGLSNK